MRCIFISEEWFEVHTYWGWFRLDRGAYEDYVAGKLWITWVPGKRQAQVTASHAEDLLEWQVLKQLDGGEAAELTAHMREVMTKPEFLFLGLLFQS